MLCRYSYENLYMKSKALSHSNSVFRYTAKFHMQLICWMLHWKEKQTTLPSSYGVLLQQRENKSRWYATAIRFDYVARLYRPRIVEYRHPKCLANWNWWVQFDLPQTATFVGRRPGFVNIFSKKQNKKNPASSSYTQNLAIVYHRLLLPFLSAYAVWWCKMLFVFRFSETFSKWFVK